MNWAKIADTIAHIPHGANEFRWPRWHASQLRLMGSLSGLLPNESVEAALSFDGSPSANRRLRALVSPHLRRLDPKLVGDLAVWIVRDWGGDKARNGNGSSMVPRARRLLSGLHKRFHRAAGN